MNLAELFKAKLAAKHAAAKTKRAREPSRSRGVLRVLEQRLGVVRCEIVGLHLKTPSNTRAAHWGQDAKLAARHTELGHQLAWALSVAGITRCRGKKLVPRKRGKPLVLPDADMLAPRVEVTLVRVGKKPLDKDDNLRAAFKHLKDGVTQALGLTTDDGPRTLWTYPPQETGPYAARITVRALPAEGS